MALIKVKIEQDGNTYDLTYDNNTSKINKQYENFKMSKKKRIKLSLFNQDGGGRG